MLDNSLVISVEDFDFSIIEKAPVLQPLSHTKGKARRAIVDLVTAFDIETTGLDDIEQSIMYIWQWQIETVTVIGRTWREFTRFIYRLEKALKGKFLVVYVHNLSFEFQFLSGILRFSSDDVFSIDRRKVCYARYRNCIEFRCSYIHSNMSLSVFLDKMGVENKKLTGFDYNKKRYPWTELSDRELEYCINDVKGLVQAIRKEMKMDGDTLQTIPLTSTGYVRRDAKKAMQFWPHQALEDMKPDIALWAELREAFRGGDTHANRYYSGYILKNVHSYDRSSSYPDVICNCQFPMSKFEFVGEVSLEELIEKMKKRGRACLFRIALKHIRLVNEMHGCPYLTIDKGRKLVNAENDNGRILEADYGEFTITDIDFRIIAKEYDFSIVWINDLYTARYGKLPQPIIDLCCEFYQKKTALKGVEGQEVYYEKIKNKFNSIYGMMAQNPVRRTVLFNQNEENPFTYDRSKTDEEILQKYNKKSFLMYQWGVWVTAWARLRLHEGIEIAGNGFVYCDTDSVKYIGELNGWESYNKQRILDSEKSGATATDKTGKRYYMGVYESEGVYDRFVTMGAKKYAFEKNGKIGITVAGVGKKAGAIELGKLENFREGFVFSDAGGLESVYNDKVDMLYDIEGHTIEITKNVYFRPSTYTLGITAEYARILEKGRYIMEKLRNIY